MIGTSLQEKVLVGEVYLVPCITVPLWRGAEPAPWPILGPAHSDNGAIRASTHFHWDVRFFPGGDFFPVRVGSVIAVATPRDLMAKVHFMREPVEVEYRWLECTREQPEFPIEQAPWSDALRIAFRDIPLKPGQLCPHQGVYLGGMAQDKEGCVTCPGHGLRWNLGTGRQAV